jgi:hypothetical protein
MPPEIEAIKHIGDWVDGKLVCKPDCPSITHKKDIMTTQQEIERIVEEFMNPCVPGKDGVIHIMPHVLQYKIRTTLVSLTEAHIQHEHEMYEELEKAHKVEMESLVKEILSKRYFKSMNDKTDVVNGEVIKEVAKKFNIEENYSDVNFVRGNK